MIADRADKKIDLGLIFESQNRLSHYYSALLGAPENYSLLPDKAETANLRRFEDAWITEEEHLCGSLALPVDVKGFKSWYRALFKTQISNASIFFDYIADEARLDEMALYICLEELVDGRFDDIVALAQIGLQGNEKLALARNYWDEMGCGDYGSMHTLLFCRSSEYFRGILAESELSRLLSTTTAALKNSNLLLLLATNKRHSVKLLGAITLMEHTAPHRFSKTVAGMRRLMVPEDAVYYHEMHIKVDARHGDDLLNEVLLPIMERRPDLIREIAVGMVIRLNIASNYYDELAGICRQ